MKLSLLAKKLGKIKIGDIIYDKSTDSDCNFRYCKVDKIDEYIWGIWYKTLKDIEINNPSYNSKLPGIIENCVKV